MTCRMSMGGADCAEGSDPRHVGRCYRCDRPILKVESTRRNLRLEQEIIREATRGAIDPTHLIEHAQIRADKLSGEYVRNPMHIRPGRDRVLDAREEACDGVNHCTFWLQEHLDADDDAKHEVLLAIRFFALAYDRLCDVEG